MSEAILKSNGGQWKTAHASRTNLQRQKEGFTSAQQGDRVRHYAIATALVLWLGAVAAGMGMLWQYSVTPGMPAKAPPIWPAQSKIPLSRDKLNLVMAVHPRCPCSRASIGELAVLMARTDSRIAASVIFVHGPGLHDRGARTDQWARTDEWAKTDLWHSAQAIVGVATLVDDGSEARLFGAATSGQTLVYDRRGRLLFSGGITVARGHWGDSAGLAAICELTGRLTASKPAGETLVFGCPLFSKASHLAGTHEPCLK